MSLTHHPQTSVPKRGHISCHGYLWVYSTCHKKLYKIWQTPQKFCAVSMRIPQSFCAANCGIAVLVLRSVSHFRGMILCCPRNDVQYRWRFRLLTTTSRLPFQYSRNTVRFRGCLCRLWLCWWPSTNPRTPFDDSLETFRRFYGYPRRCHEKIADHQRGQSVDFVKFLVTSTVPFLSQHVHYVVYVEYRTYTLAVNVLRYYWGTAKCILFSVHSYRLILSEVPYDLVAGFFKCDTLYTSLHA